MENRPRQPDAYPVAVGGDRPGCREGTGVGEPVGARAGEEFEGVGRRPFVTLARCAHELLRDRLGVYLTKLLRDRLGVYLTKLLRDRLGVYLTKLLSDRWWPFVRLGGRAADGQDHPRDEAGRAEAGEDVGGAGAQHGWQVDAAGNGQVAAQSLPGQSEGQEFPGGEEEGQTPAHHPIVDRHWALRAGQGDRCRRGRPHRQATEGDLDGGVQRWIVADEGRAVRERRPVGGTGRAHTDGSESRPPRVLHERQRPGPHHLEAHRSTATKRTHQPGRSSAGGSRSASHSAAVVRPISCQPPGEDRG